MSEKITDFEERAKARLPEQFKNKVRIEGALDAFSDEVQELEDAADQVLLERTLADSIGEQLDLLGTIFDEPRAGQSDADYRDAIKQKIFRIGSNGEPNTLLDSLKFLAGSVSTKLTELFPATVFLRSEGGSIAGKETFIAQTLQTIKPAGVRLFPINQVAAGDAFAFLGGGGKGFTTLASPVGTGGVYSTIIK